MSIPIISRTTIGLAPRGGAIHWARAIGYRDRITEITSGTIGPTNPDRLISELQASPGNNTCGLSLNERFVRHRSVVVDETEASIESRAKDEISNLVPDDAESTSFRCAWRSSTSGGGGILSVSAVSDVAVVREIESLPVNRQQIDCLSSPAQDLPYLLAYTEDFIVGSSYVVFTDNEYSAVLEYQNSALLGTAHFYGSPGDVLPDLELELVRLNSNTIPARPITVVGPATSDFVRAADRSSIGVPYGCVSVRNIGKCIVSVDSANVCVVALAIRLFHENTFGVNFAESSDICNRRKTNLGTRTRQIRRASVVVATVLTVFLSLANFVVSSSISGATDELDALSSVVAQFSSQQQIVQQRKKDSAEIFRLLDRQTNHATLLSVLGRSRTIGSHWTRLTITTKAGGLAAVSIRGVADQQSSLAAFVRSVESQPLLDNVSGSSTSSLSGIQSATPDNIAFEVTAVVGTTIR